MAEMHVRAFCDATGTSLHLGDSWYHHAGLNFDLCSQVWEQLSATGPLLPGQKCMYHGRANERPCLASVVETAPRGTTAEVELEITLQLLNGSQRTQVIGAEGQPSSNHEWQPVEEAARVSWQQQYVQISALADLGTEREQYVGASQRSAEGASAQIPFPLIMVQTPAGPRMVVHPALANSMHGQGPNSAWAAFVRDAMNAQNQEPQLKPTSKDALDAMESGLVVAGEEEDFGPCAVCQDQFSAGEEFRRIPCGHTFHADCLAPWLKDHNTCPTCRHELPVESQPQQTSERSDDGVDAASDSGVGQQAGQADPQPGQQTFGEFQQQMARAFLQQHVQQQQHTQQQQHMQQQQQQQHGEPEQIDQQHLQMIQQQMARAFLLQQQQQQQQQHGEPEQIDQNAQQELALQAMRQMQQAQVNAAEAEEERMVRAAIEASLEESRPRSPESTESRPRTRSPQSTESRTRSPGFRRGFFGLHPTPSATDEATGPAAASGVDDMSVRQLKAVLSGAGVDFSDCVERSDLVAKARRVRTAGPDDENGTGKRLRVPEMRQLLRQRGVDRTEIDGCIERIELQALVDATGGQ